MNQEAESKMISDAVTPTGGQSRIRLLARIICLVLAVLALWPLAANTWSLLLIPALSPFVALSSLIATRTFHSITWLGLTIGAVVLFRHRLFCRWICPMGLCADGASRLGERLGRKSIRVPLLGRWILWLTLGAAILGYTFLLWLDPLSIFSDTFSLRHSSKPEIWLPALSFFAILILSLIWPRIWCRRLCPLGALQDILSLLYRSLRSVIVRNAETNKTSPADIPLARRTVLGLSIGAASALISRPYRTKASPPLRPPGAQDESLFVGLCTRCGNCLRTCPTSIIERDINPNSLTGLFTPVLNLENGYCKEDCIKCTNVCPSGAIQILPLKQKANIKIGLARVDMNICLLGEDRDCSACMRWCPYDAIQYVFSETYYALTPTIDPKKCNGCGACQTVCPTKPRKAIVITPNSATPL